MSELKTTCETTQAVAAEDTGRWLVTTEHSRHIWDLDAMTYTRLPEHPDAQPHAYDETVVKINRVVHNPEADFPEGQLAVSVKQSSPIRSLEYLGGGDTP